VLRKIAVCKRVNTWVQIMDLSVSATGEVVSASVDSTARIWHSGKCTQVLQGHEGSVLAVLALPDGDMLTASSDKTIKRWQKGVCIGTLTGHSDSVRCLALMPGVGVSYPLAPL
jgi:phospholipase A-2-activating protein